MDNQNEEIKGSEVVRPRIFLEKHIVSTGKACPTATLNIEENIKNRNWTIRKFAYGPLNPSMPSPEFWAKKANLWNTDIKQAMSARCGNCAAFDQSPKLLECIKKGINENRAADPGEVLVLADLGYCQLFKFKCAADRSCDAWLHGGPIT